MKKHHPHATDPYDYENLKDFWDFSLSDKIDWSKKVIEDEMNKSDDPVVSFSGGKSSQVVLHLSLQVNEDISVVLNDTGVMYPETNEFVKELADEWDFKDNLIITDPEKTFWEIVDEYRFPGNRSGSGTPRCCFWLKERPMRGIVDEHGFDVIITGEQASESQNRQLVFLQYGEAFDYHNWENYLGKVIRKVKPISIWKDEDIWKYINKNDLPFNPVYEKYDIERTGCVTCTAFEGWEDKMKKYSKNLFDKINKEMED